MKKFIVLQVLSLIFLVLSVQTAVAQPKRLNTSPQNFQTFFSKFIKAVKKNNKTAVAIMTRFPFKYGFDAGDEGTMSKSRFIKRFNEIFGDSPKQFLPEKNPLFSKNGSNIYIISTEEASHLTFIKKGNGFKFISYYVEP